MILRTIVSNNFGRFFKIKLFYRIDSRSKCIISLLINLQYSAFINKLYILRSDLMQIMNHISNLNNKTLMFTKRVFYFYNSLK